MKKAFITKIENLSGVEIHNFQYLSGNSYKASFVIRDIKNGRAITTDVVVKKNETYLQAVERTINK